MSKNHSWTTGELTYLKNMWQNTNVSAEEIAINLGLRESQVRNMVCEKGYKRNKCYKNVNNVPGKKYCAKCKQYLPLDDFYNDKTKIFGKSQYCKKCNHELYEERKVK